MSTVQESKTDQNDDLKSTTVDILLTEPVEVNECSENYVLEVQKREKWADDTAAELTSNLEMEEDVKSESAQNELYEISDDILLREQEEIKECSENNAIGEQKSIEFMDHLTQKLAGNLSLEKDKPNKITIENSNAPKDQNPNIKRKHVDRRQRKFANESLENNETKSEHVEEEDKERNRRKQIEIRRNLFENVALGNKESKAEHVEEGDKEENQNKTDRRRNRFANKALEDKETKAEHVEEEDKKGNRSQIDRRQNRFENKALGNTETKAEQMEEGDEEEFYFFWKSESPFSQWYPSRFTVDEITFECAEQYMMHEKAVLFEDFEVASEIKNEGDPQKQKSLGRKVRNFNQKEWDENCLEIVKRGNMEKFSQNSELYEYMIGTHPKTLVEASPDDMIWGIGLEEHEEEAKNRKTWRGKNLLGQALTEVRNKLLEQAELRDEIGECLYDKTEVGNKLMEQANSPSQGQTETGEVLHDKTEVGNKLTEQADSQCEVQGETGEVLHDKTDGNPLIL